MTFFPPVGPPSGYFFFCICSCNPRLHDLFWALLGICGRFLIIMILTIDETRHNTIPARLNSKNGKTLESDLLPRMERIDKAAGNLFEKPMKRSSIFLGTEAIVPFSSLHDDYLYLLLPLQQRICHLFGTEGHGFGSINVGLTFLGLCVGISIGPLTNDLFHEPYFQRQL